MVLVSRSDSFIRAGFHDPNAVAGTPGGGGGGGGGTFPPDTTLTYVTPPSVPAVPGYLTQVVEPTWGTHLERISNVNLQRNAYARIPAWNCDQTKILLGFSNAPYAYLDGTTYAILRTTSSLVGYATWSNVNPNKLYGTFTGDTNFYSQNPTTDAFTVIRNFAGDGYTEVSLGDGEGTIDDTDTRVVLMTRAAGGTQGAIVYNIATNTIEATRTFGGIRPNNAGITRLGGYVIVSFSADGSTSTTGLWKFNRDFSGGVQLTTTARHGDGALDASGNEIFVTCSPNFISYDMASNTPTTLVANGNAFQNGHVSGRNITRHGWVYASMYDNTGMASHPGYDQVVAIKTDGSGTVEVFGFSNSRSNGYNQSPFAVPSPDGQRVAFGSDWGNGPNTYAYVFSA